MPTEQLIQMPAVHTDRFSITFFATYSTQGTVIEQNLGKMELKTQVLSVCASVNIHNTLYTGRCTIYTITHVLYKIRCIEYPIYFTLHTIQNTPYIF